jgi:hypothetical protein
MGQQRRAAHDDARSGLRCWREYSHSCAGGANCPAKRDGGPFSNVDSNCDAAACHADRDRAGDYSSCFANQLAFGDEHSHVTTYLAPRKPNVSFDAGRFDIGQRRNIASHLLCVFRRYRVGPGRVAADSIAAQSKEKSLMTDPHPSPLQATVSYQLSATCP